MTSRIVRVLTAIDRRGDAAFEPLRGHTVPDRIMYSVTELGDFSLIWHIAACTVALRGQRGEQRALRLSATLAVESVLVNGVLKRIARRDRPNSVEPRPHHLRTPLTSSFPSGHASAATCAAILLADGQSTFSRRGWYSLAVLVALSRVYVRIHHPTDILGGAVVGWVIGRVATRYWPLTTPPDTQHASAP